MAIADKGFLTYIVGTGEDIEGYQKKYYAKHGYDPDFDLWINLQGILLGPVSFFIFPPLGILVEADFFYRIGQTMFTKKYYGKESQGLVGKVRELYKTIST